MPLGEGKKTLFQLAQTQDHLQNARAVERMHSTPRLSSVFRQTGSETGRRSVSDTHANLLKVRPVLWKTTCCCCHLLWKSFKDKSFLYSCFPTTETGVFNKLLQQNKSTNLNHDCDDPILLVIILFLPFCLCQAVWALATDDRKCACGGIFLFGCQSTNCLGFNLFPVFVSARVIYWNDKSPELISACRGTADLDKTWI